MRVVVTGGAGYIGSHCVKALARAGHQPFVIDDLSNGHRDAVVEIELGDVTAPGALAGFARRVEAEAILHFAARIQVGESVARPDLYYGTNVGGMLRVVEVARERRIPVVLSSTAAVYGEPVELPIPVTHPCRPENPYGWSKLISERILGDCAGAAKFPYAILRYFNAAGAADGLSERHSPETHLVPLVIDAARGRGKALTIYGDDWPTSDGTCLRDYVHVVDLAEAHLLALEKLAAGTPAASIVANLGGGKGTTVRQVIDEVARAVGRPVPHSVGPRRPGDVASLVADTSEAERLLGWKPQRSEIRQIVEDAVRSRAAE